jgi:hypothetical protein
LGAILTVFATKAVNGIFKDAAGFRLDWWTVTLPSTESTSGHWHYHRLAVIGTLIR